MACFCFLLSENHDAKIKNAVRGCIVHDIAESLVGDITHEDKIPKGKKPEYERNTVVFLQSLIPKDSPLRSSWEDFETGQSFTNAVTRDFDKIDLVIKASIYERKTNIPLNEFFVSAQRVVHFKDLVEQINDGKTRAITSETEASLESYYKAKDLE
jgi:putative hydrolase of HD superfamily